MLTIYAVSTFGWALNGIAFPAPPNSRGVLGTSRRARSRASPTDLLRLPAHLARDDPQDGSS
jgi:hypothetical protein